MCKKYNPNISIEVTDDETPNLGYTLSNKKLLSTGFKFLHNLDNSIKEMIEKWSYEKFDNSLEYIYRGKNEFADERL